MVTRDATTEVLPSGLEVRQIGKRRQRSKYYRRVTVQGGEMVWVQTELLPSDAEGRAYYMAKGFRLDPPEGTEFALDNTAEKIKKENEALKAEADRLAAEAERNRLLTEIANLKRQLEDKGIKEGSGKVGRPKRGRLLT